MKPTSRPNLSPRERNIMDILYARGRATAIEVMNDLSGNPHLLHLRRGLQKDHARPGAE